MQLNHAFEYIHISSAGTFRRFHNVDSKLSADFKLWGYTRVWFEKRLIWLRLKCFRIWNEASQKTTICIFQTICQQRCYLLNCTVSCWVESGQFVPLWLAKRWSCPFRSPLWHLVPFIILVQERCATQSMEMWIGNLEWYSYEPKRLAIKDEFSIIYLPLGFYSSIAVTL